jgi:hypothetical protein
MPACLSCGNRVAFVHQVRGTETRLYNANGEYDGSEYQQFETTAWWCDECGSDNVEFDR